jgi:uncharacterized protein (DUF2062 family)
VTLTIVWYLHVRIIRKIWKKGIWTSFKEALSNNNESNLKKASAVGFGIFMGIIPIWGFQILAAAALAKLMRLNVIITVVSSNISIPPMIPVLLFMSYWVGGIFLNDSIALTWNSGLGLSDIYTNIKQYLIGSFLFAAMAGIVMFLVAFILLKIFRKEGA